MYDVILVVANSRRKELQGVFPDSVLVTEISEGLAGARTKNVVVDVSRSEYSQGSDVASDYYSSQLEYYELKLRPGGRVIRLR